MKRQLSFAFSLSALISAAAMAADQPSVSADVALTAEEAAPAKDAAPVKSAPTPPKIELPYLERVKPLANPEITCANYEKVIASCQKEDARLREIGKKKFKLLDAYYAPTLKVAEEAYLLFGGCGLYYSDQIKAGKVVTQDIKALLAAEEQCFKLTHENFGMHVESLSKKMTEDRNELLGQFYKLHITARQLLDASAWSLRNKNKIEASATNEDADKVEKKNEEKAQDLYDHNPYVRRKVDNLFPDASTKNDKHGKKNSKLPGTGMSMGNMLKTALGLGTLGAGLGIGINDLMNMPNLADSLGPLVNPAAAPAAAAATDSGAAAAASGGGIGSTNPTVADSSMVRLTAEVMEYADGRRLVNGKEVGKLQSGTEDDPARPDNSGRSGGGSTSASTTLNSQGLVSSEKRSIARPLSAPKDSSRRERYADEQSSSDENSADDRRNHRDK